MSYQRRYTNHDLRVVTPQPSDFLIINVCGMKYETLKSTLEMFPDTLLGNPEHRCRYFVQCKDAFFFDRHRKCFDAILYYYQSGGLLVRPQDIPMDVFAEEVLFFCLDADELKRLQQSEGYIEEETDHDHLVDQPKNHWQRKLWELMEYPDSSMMARTIALWSIFVIVVSIVVFCMETMPEFGIEEKQNEIRRRKENGTNGGGPEYLQPWFSLELSCILWFTIEYLVRLLAAPNKWRFVKSFLNMIDLIAIIPYFIILPINSGDTTPLSVLRVARLVRVFRIFKLSRHSMGLQILGHTFRASVSELGMLVFFLLLGVILFSSALFYAEDSQHTNVFFSIPDAFWYSLVTMTTVGYGDKVPKTLIGKIVGSMCAVCGVLTVALPVPVIVSNFEFFYKRDRLLSKNNERKRSRAGSNLSNNSTQRK